MGPNKSPFKANSELRAQIGGFLRTHRAIFSQEAKRTSAYFEIAAYNDLVKYYENNGFKLKPQNLKSPGRTFVYAMSPNAKPGNCSYFLATRKYKNGDQWRFEIRHNLRIQSAHDRTVFFTPDYAVVTAGSVKKTSLDYYYNGKADYFYVAAKDVQTFAETKHYNPSPELVINFVGLVNEVLPKILRKKISRKLPKHCAPTLFVSGVGSRHVRKIAESLSRRYGLNVLLGLFAYPSQLYSQRNQVNINKIGSK